MDMKREETSGVERGRIITQTLPTHRSAASATLGGALQRRPFNWPEFIRYFGTFSFVLVRAATKNLLRFKNLQISRRHRCKHDGPHSTFFSFTFWSTNNEKQVRTDGWKMFKEHCAISKHHFSANSIRRIFFFL